MRAPSLPAPGSCRGQSSEGPFPDQLSFEFRQSREEREDQLSAGRRRVDAGPLAGSLKLGWVTASLLISKLQAGARENVLSRALRDLGRLVKTQFILRWIENPDYRRRIHRQLNKGEALHELRRFLFFAHEGKVQRRQADQQTNQVLCLNLVTNAIVTWNTVYINTAIERLRAEGRIGRDIDLGHLSPALLRARQSLRQVPIRDRGSSARPPTT